MLNYFNFKRWSDQDILVTNDFGCHEFLSPTQFKDFMGGNLEKASNLYNSLREKHFIVENEDIVSEDLTNSLRSMKDYIFHGPALHIFVVTNQCNLQCVYCQAQRHHGRHKGFMTEEIGRRAVDIALQSPERHLSFEFQGGEPLLNFPVIRSMVEYAEQHRGEKAIDFTIVSNFQLLTDEIARFCLDHHISICTSLDGPQALQEKNRRALGQVSSYRKAVDGLKLLRRYGYMAGAIQTTTRYSLPAARRIVREYQRLGLNQIFIRPLTPLGFAAEDWQEIGYTPEEFLAFYSTCFDEVLKINREGVCFREQHACIFLRKILGGFSTNYMELRSPCGAGVGQLAYYYDGNIYTCDEARMVAEAGNQAFRLGSVYNSTLNDLVQGRVCRAVCSASILETLPGCSDCVYQPYCGVCPVISLAQHGDIFAKEMNGYRCKVYRGILDFLFELLHEGDLETLKILQSWIGDENREDNEEGFSGQKGFTES